jgi:hypothetical protein
MGNKLNLEITWLRAIVKISDIINLSYRCVDLFEIQRREGPHTALENISVGHTKAVYILGINSNKLIPIGRGQNWNIRKGTFQSPAFMW